jgi:hypothetical protein
VKLKARAGAACRAEMKPALAAMIAAIARDWKAFRPNIESSLNAKAQARFARQSNGIVRGLARQFKQFDETGFFRRIHLPASEERIAS